MLVFKYHKHGLGLMYLDLLDFLILNSHVSMFKMSAIDEALRIVLEVINSCLSNQLIHNPNLVYALLYQRKVFEPLKSHEAFHDVIQNIDMVITFFSAKLEREEELLNSSDVNTMLSRVQHWSLQWPRDLMKV